MQLVDNNTVRFSTFTIVSVIVQAVSSFSSSWALSSNRPKTRARYGSLISDVRLDQPLCYFDLILSDYM